MNNNVIKNKDVAESSNQERTVSKKVLQDAGSVKFDNFDKWIREWIFPLIATACKAMAKGEKLPLNTGEGLVQEILIMGMGVQPHAFFERVYGKRYRNVNFKILRKDELCALMLQTMEIFRRYSVDGGLDIETVKNYALSFDDGKTLSFFGAGVTKVVDKIVEKYGLTKPVVNPMDIVYVLSDLKFARKKLFNGAGETHGVTAVPKNSLRLDGMSKEDTVEAFKDWGDIVYIRKSFTAFVGAETKYTYEGKEGFFLYGLEDKTYANAVVSGSRSSLFNYPLSFLRRKLKNSLLKTLFSDYGFDLEANLEGGDSLLHADTTDLSWCQTAPDKSTETAGKSVDLAVILERDAEPFNALEIPGV